MNERQAKVDAVLANVFLDYHFRSGLVDRKVREAYVEHWTYFMQCDLGPKVSSVRAIMATHRGLKNPFCWWWSAFVLKYVILPLLTSWWEEK